MFTRTGTTWTSEAYLKTWNAEGGDSWGVSVALSDDGNTLAIGSLDEDCLCAGRDMPIPMIGIGDQKADCPRVRSAIFVRAGGNVEPAGVPQGVEPGQDDWFGVRLALSGDGNTLAVVAPNEDSGARGINGQADNERHWSPAPCTSSRAAAPAGAGGVRQGREYRDAFDEFGGSVGQPRRPDDGDWRAKGEDSARDGRQRQPGRQLDGRVRRRCTSLRARVLHFM